MASSFCSFHCGIIDYFCCPLLIGIFGFTHTLAIQTFFSEFETVGRWCLWLAALITIGTISAGFYAYYTVKHDAVSHAAMTVHRNWALLTALSIFLMACWSVRRYVKHQKLTLLFVIPLLVVQGLLLTTAWHGGELVYRYGIGVMSLPQAEEVGHQHTQDSDEQH